MVSDLVSDLLPGPDQAPACSAFTQDLGLRPWGSGLTLDRIIVVDVPLPWPKPALAHDLLKSASPLVATAPLRTRLFAGEPRPGVDDLFVELYERDGLGFRSCRWPIDPARPTESIAEVVAAIVEAPLGRHPMPPIEVTVPTFLVCTQGSHDSCCGTSGVELADRIRFDRDAYRVRRISHTGGHRFAPTLVALPSGRMWAWADLDLVDRIAASAETAEDFSTRCRGWLGVASGPAQVAELTVRATVLNPHDVEPTVEVHEGDPIECTVHINGTQWRVAVRQSRTVPTIACESPGGQPSKLAVEYEAEVVEVEQ